MDDPGDNPEGGDATWFRQPTRREQWIGFWLFLGFAIFFGVFFRFYSGAGYRWILLGLAVLSLGRALRHGFKALRTKR